MRLRCKERLKQSRLNLWRNASARILHAYNKETIHDIRLDLYNTGALDRIDTVPYKVFQDLAEQTVVEPDRGPRRHQSHFDADIRRRLEIGNKLLDGSVRTPSSQMRLRKP